MSTGAGGGFTYMYTPESFQFLLKFEQFRVNWIILNGSKVSYDLPKVALGSTKSSKKLYRQQTFLKKKREMKKSINLQLSCSSGRYVTPWKLIWLCPYFGPQLSEQRQRWNTLFFFLLPLIRYEDKSVLQEVTEADTQGWSGVHPTASWRRPKTFGEQNENRLEPCFWWTGQKVETKKPCFQPQSANVKY